MLAAMLVLVLQEPPKQPELPPPLVIAERILTVANRLRIACTATSTADTSVIQKNLLTICNWRIPSDPRSPTWRDPALRETLAALRRWATDTLTVVSGGASALAADDGPSTRGGALPFDLSARASTVLWGVADFVVDRAREQANVWAIARAWDLACSPTGPLAGFTALLANSCELLGATRNDATMLGSSWLVGLTSAAQRDVAALPERALSTAVFLAGEQGASGRAIATSLLLLAPLSRGESPATAVRDLAARIPDGLRAALGADTLAAGKIYRLSLLLDAIAPVGIDYTVKAAWLLAGSQRFWAWDADFSEATLSSAASLAIRISSTLASVEHLLAEAADLASEPITFDGPAEQSDRQRRDRRARLLEFTWEVGMLAARLGNVPPDLQAKLDAARRMVRGIVTDNYGDAVAALVTLANEAPFTGRLPGTRFLVFLTDLAQSNDPDQVRTVLQRFAAPPGTYRVKRLEGATFLSVNAYLGAGGGVERAGRDWAPVAGVSLPLGLEATAWRSGGWSFGFFLQVLDLGALASWRLEGGSDVEQRPEIGVDQVFAPGLFFVTGVRDAPISIGMGVAGSPALRRLKASGQLRSAFRAVALFVAMDVPLFAHTAAPRHP